MNFPNPSPEELHALAKLSNNSDWKTVQAWLKRVLQQQDIENRSLRDHLLPQGQGAAQAIAYILEMADGARATMTKILERVKG